MMTERLEPRLRGLILFERWDFGVETDMGGDPTLGFLSLFYSLDVCFVCFVLWRRRRRREGDERRR
jgi:hypothetical protein